MIVPDSGELCADKNCGMIAESFHPYIGFCCKVHLEQAQRKFCEIETKRDLQPFKLYFQQ